jgi:shikimate kinase
VNGLMNVILTGLRGTGKTSLGRLLARTLQRPFFDTDVLIEQQIGEPIPHYVARLGWDAFREVEHQMICQVARQRHAVLSTGGGALTYTRNAEMLKPHGVIILLAADPVTLARRLERSYARPPLTAEPSLEAEMRTLWAQREPLYRQVCDVVFRVDAETVDEEADFQTKVVALLDLLHPFLHEAAERTVPDHPLRPSDQA